MLLYGVGVSDAHRIGEEIRGVIAALEIPHADAPNGIVTVSIGAAVMVPERDSGVDDLIESADAALYASKQRRNTVTAYEPRVFRKAG
jgi:diguanylate cyclase (GGDEF)-like protein